MDTLRVAFAGTFWATLEPSVRAQLGVPCDVILTDEASAASRLADVDVLVTLAFTREMGAAAKRLKLVQVPGAGLDRIDRSAVPVGTALANVYGHEVGIAEYVLGAMLASTRAFARLDAALREGRWEAADASAIPARSARTGREHCTRSRLQHRPHEAAIDEHRGSRDIARSLGGQEGDQR